jgi:hypothetical protein
MNEQILIAMSDVTPIDSFQGMNIFNSCHVFQALENHGISNWKDDPEIRFSHFDAAAEILDATVYTYPKWECCYSEGVSLAVRNGKRGFVLFDLS